MSQADVPSPIDLQSVIDARAWEARAMARPGRLEMFAQFAACIEDHGSRRVLELGSGPGFLARYLIERIPGLQMDLLDFSSAMHMLAESRLSGMLDHVRFIERDFKQPDWNAGLEGYDCIITNQAIHELRHKRHAPRFHGQVRQLMDDRSQYLLCDHFFGEGGMADDQLYMTVAEQSASVHQAGFRIRHSEQNSGLLFLQANL